VNSFLYEQLSGGMVWYTWHKLNPKVSVFMEDTKMGAYEKVFHSRRWLLKIPVGSLGSSEQL
jgi:hypothetical protein